MAEGNRIVGITRWAMRLPPAGYAAIQTTVTSPRLPAHFLQHFINDAPVNELVQIRQRLSLRPAQFRRGSGFEKVFDQIWRHLRAVFESQNRVCLDDILVSLTVPPKRGMLTY